MDVKRILILSASYGEGHRQAAYAIKEAFSVSHPEIEVKIIDYIHEVNRVWNQFSRFVYIQGIKYIPRVYGFFYKQVNRITPKSALHRKINFFGVVIGKKKLLEFIRTFDPQIVIHTFTTSAAALMELEEQHKVNLPSITVITDYILHRQWIHPTTDLYLVGANIVKDQLLQEGVPEEKVKVTGIPIRQEFYKKRDRNKLAEELGFDPNVPTVLVSAGAYGVSSQILSLCKHLFHSDTKMQVMVVCGRNRRLYEQMQQLVAEAKQKVVVFGFTNRMADLMAISDVMFTKSGGLTVSECMAMELPMVFFKPIPGQEMANAKFLEDAGVAKIASSQQQVEEILVELIQKPHILQDMKGHFQTLKSSQLTQPIDQVILSVCQKLNTPLT